HHPVVRRPAHHRLLRRRVRQRRLGADQEVDHQRRRARGQLPPGPRHRARRRGAPPHRPLRADGFFGAQGGRRHRPPGAHHLDQRAAAGHRRPEVGLAGGAAGGRGRGVDRVPRPGGERGRVLHRHPVGHRVRPGVAPAQPGPVPPHRPEPDPPRAELRPGADDPPPAGQQLVRVDLLLAPAQRAPAALRPLRRRLQPGGGPPGLAPVRLRPDARLQRGGQLQVPRQHHRRRGGPLQLRAAGVRADLLSHAEGVDRPGHRVRDLAPGGPRRGGPAAQLLPHRLPAGQAVDVRRLAPGAVPGRAQRHRQQRDAVVRLLRSERRAGEDAGAAAGGGADARAQGGVLMLMRTRRALLLLATALGLGCTQDDPDDVFYWLGRVDDAGGAPRPGATVALADAPSQRTPSCIPTARLLLQFSVVDNTYSLGTLDYQPLKETAANEDGDWFFDLMRFEISPTLNDAPHCFLISSQGPGGTSIRSTTPGQATDLEFPDLVQWAPALAVQPGPPASVAPPDLPWAPSRDAVEIDVGHTRTSAYDWVIAGPGGEIAWQQITLGDPLALDPDLLEDFPGLSVGLEAWLFDQVEHHGPFGSTSGAVYWT